MLLSVLLVLILAGVALYVISLIPMDATILQLIRVLVIVVAILYVLRVFGLLAPLARL